MPLSIEYQTKNKKHLTREGYLQCFGSKIVNYWWKLGCKDWKHFGTSKIEITVVKMIFRFFTCLKYSLDKKSKISQCAKDNKFIWCCISVKFQFEMVVLKVLREFAGGTSIHGFTFLVRPKSSSWTKIIWAISLVVALTYATLEMRNSVVGKYDYIFRTMKFNQWLLMHM